jgi:WD40 repeat protein
VAWPPSSQPSSCSKHPRESAPKPAGCADRPLTGHPGRVSAVAFGVDRAGHWLLATAGDDRTLRLWDPDSTRLLMTFQRREPVTVLASGPECLAIADPEAITVIGGILCPH